MPPPAPIQDWLADLRSAASFLTRVPLGRHAWSEHDDPARATRAYPLVGLGVGLAGGLAFWLASVLALPPAACALIAIAATMVLTGALHEDGLADVADGFGGGLDRARKLAIMRDSRIGAYGVAALVLSIGLRAAALTALAPGAAALALIAAHGASRGVLGPVLAITPLARADGLAASVRQPSAQQAATALGLALVIAALALGPLRGLSVLVLAVLAAVILAALARWQIGGTTGDVLGATQQTAETAILLALAALVSTDTGAH